MTANEIQILLIGAALGAQSMNVMHAVLAGRGANRAATASEVALKNAAADRYLSSLRLYQLQNRSRA